MIAYRKSNSIRLVVCLAMLVLLSACVPTKVVNTWHTDQTAYVPNKIAVIAVLPDALMRQAVEVDVAEILTKKGNNAIASSKIKGMSGGIRGEIDEEKARVLLAEENVDGVVVMFYTGGGRADFLRDDYYSSYIGSGVGYGWGAPGFVDVYEIRRGEDIQQFTTSAFVESSYHDLRKDYAVWRIVTETGDTEHTDTAAAVAGKIADQMSRYGLN